MLLCAMRIDSHDQLLRVDLGDLLKTLEIVLFVRGVLAVGGRGCVVLSS